MECEHSIKSRDLRRCGQFDSTDGIAAKVAWLLNCERIDRFRLNTRGARYTIGSVDCRLKEPSRWREEGTLICLRYLVTVRRASG